MTKYSVPIHHWALPGCFPPSVPLLGLPTAEFRCFRFILSRRVCEGCLGPKFPNKRAAKIKRMLWRPVSEALGSAWDDGPAPTENRGRGRQTTTILFRFFPQSRGNRKKSRFPPDFWTKKEVGWHGVPPPPCATHGMKGRPKTLHANQWTRKHLFYPV